MTRQEASLLLQQLEQADGKILALANHLDVPRSTLYHRIAKACKVLEIPQTSVRPAPRRRATRIMAVSDAHCPFQHKPSVKAATHFAEATGPDILAVLGDWTDGYSMSTYRQHPDAVKLAPNLITEITSGVTALQPLINACRETIYTLGNHEDDRADRMVADNPALAGMLDWPDLYKRYGLTGEITWVPYRAQTPHILHVDGAEIRLHHGWRFNVHSAASYAAELRDCVFVAGHAHTPRYWHQTSKMGGFSTTCIVNGHLSDEKYSRYKLAPQWRRTFTLIDVIDGRIDARLVLIEADGSFVADGELWR